MHALRSLYVNNNNLSGTIAKSSLLELTALRTLDLSNNQFCGSFPLLPTGLTTFSAGYNMLDWEHSADWTYSLRHTKLERLDISYNKILAPWISFLDFITPSLTFLSVAGNSLGASIPLGFQSQHSLIALDLTNCSMQGTFPEILFPNLVILKVAHNYFEGSITFTLIPSLAQLDISHNRFKFDVATFTSLSLIFRIDAANNALFGSLNLDDDLPSLQIADFSDNQLEYAPNFASLGKAFAFGQLELLNISHNPKLPIVTDLHTNATGLNRTLTSTPSGRFPLSVICYELAFYGRTDRVFIFDEYLFDYQQCNCSAGHFGIPPLLCFKCPIEGIGFCQGDRINVTTNYFGFLLDASTTTPFIDDSALNSAWNDFATFVSFSFEALSSLLSISPAPVHGLIPVPPELWHSTLDTETCLVTVIPTLSSKSDCRGFLITTADFTLKNASLQNLLAPQCNTGSDGRLCSKCLCNVTGSGDCWYRNGPICTQCRRVFGLQTSIPLAVVLLLLLIIALSAIFTVLLHRRRKQSVIAFEKLSLGKRIFYRLQYLTTLGNVSILITFLQILIEFTQWEVPITRALPITIFLPFLNIQLTSYTCIQNWSQLHFSFSFRAYLGSASPFEHSFHCYRCCGHFYWYSKLDF